MSLHNESSMMRDDLADESVLYMYVERFSRSQIYRDRPP